MSVSAGAQDLDPAGDGEMADGRRMSQQSGSGTDSYYKASSDEETISKNSYLNAPIHDTSDKIESAD